MKNNASTSKRIEPLCISVGEIDGKASSRRRSSTGSFSDRKSGNEYGLGRSPLPSGQPRKPRIDSAAPTEYAVRPSYMATSALGRRLTAQTNIWSGVGTYEPLASSVFHGLFPNLSPELQSLCMQCLGTTDSPELRALTDIQKAVMALVAKQSVKKSAEARNRLTKAFEGAREINGALDCLEQFLLRRAPILIYFDIASLTPHLDNGGCIR
ncbi:hypothetical protein, conserved [Eimeria tenella]|uniref:Uncharacterized protein n=1 Tax=Eimeria tenella TaxID=5802 RepID=U6KXA8_EIMTE|nr:hypothetical protein, conserved [Eimeria tenella]CDJ41563.1 hypothetical protein, conserved [Eimeria tenella]|eukprot:XP_013232313.1 hypothetical protein, conserved [Eimeria tenella]